MSDNNIIFIYYKIDLIYDIKSYQFINLILYINICQNNSLLIDMNNDLDNMNETYHKTQFLAN